MRTGTRVRAAGTAAGAGDVTVRRAGRKKAGVDAAAVVAAAAAAAALAVEAGTEAAEAERVNAGAVPRGRAVSRNGGRMNGAEREDAGAGVTANAAAGAGASASASAAGWPDAEGRRSAALGRWLAGRVALGESTRGVVFDLHVRKGQSLGAVAEALGMSADEVAREWRAAQAELAAAAPSREEDFTMLREELAARLRHAIEQTHVWVPQAAQGVAQSAGRRGAGAGAGRARGAGAAAAAAAATAARSLRSSLSLSSSSSSSSSASSAGDEAEGWEEGVPREAAEAVTAGAGTVPETMVEVQPTTQMLAIRLKAMDQLSKLYGMSLEREPAPQGPQPYAAPEEVADCARRWLLEVHGMAGAGGGRGEVDGG